MENKHKLRVHSYESLGTYDGPGLRLVVFLQGCNFRCLYCANVDTIPCKGGTLTDPQDILNRARNQRPFFGKRGGITFSGGDPLLQAEALIPLCKQLKEEGFHICIDTNGSVLNDHVKTLLQWVDLVLLDIKHIHPEKHMALTERSNTNTLRLAEYLESIQRHFWLRYVLVPTISDDEEDLRALGEHFKDYKNIEHMDILPYHTLGKHKYEELKQPYQLEGVPTNTPEQLDKAKTILDEYFEKVMIM